MHGSEYAVVDDDVNHVCAFSVAGILGFKSGFDIFGNQAVIRICGESFEDKTYFFKFFVYYSDRNGGKTGYVFLNQAVVAVL